MSTEATPFKRVLPVIFTGESLEYFKIWIVNLCLTILTLGIYSAWAKVRRTRYFYGNTRVEQYAFNYLAEPLQILKGRLIAVTFLVLYYLAWDFYPDAAILLLGIGFLLLPFILIASASFNMYNTSYRNIRFYFQRDYRGAYRMFIKPIAIVLIFTWAGYELLDYTGWVGVEMEDGTTFTRNDFLSSILLFTLMPAVPYLDYLRAKIIVSNTQYGERKAEFAGKASDFYAIYLIAFILMMVALGIFMVIMFITVFLLFAGISDGGKLENTEISFTYIILSMLMFYVLTFFVSGYMRAARTNLIYNKTTFDEISLNSTLKAMRVGMLYLTNTIAIIVSLGMLIPWAQIRMARYVAGCIELESRDMGDIATAPNIERNALGEEMVDAFNLDLGL